MINIYPWITLLLLITIPPVSKRYILPTSTTMIEKLTQRVGELLTTAPTESVFTASLFLGLGYLVSQLLRKSSNFSYINYDKS